MTSPTGRTAVASPALQNVQHAPDVDAVLIQPPAVLIQPPALFLQSPAVLLEAGVVLFEALEDLAAPPGNRLEALKGDRAGTYSIRINDQWRICFEWRNGDAFGVEIADYH